MKKKSEIDSKVKVNLHTIKKKMLNKMNDFFCC